MPLEQTWLLRSDAPRQVSVATASGYGTLPQLQPYRSHGHRGIDKAICLYGENRMLTLEGEGNAYLHIGCDGGQYIRYGRYLALRRSSFPPGTIIASLIEC
jgi:hypothetical protein